MIGLPELYEELVVWEDDDDAFIYMTTGIGMHPGHGLRALEIQQRIWSFLVSCCTQILQDLPLELLIGGDAQPEPQPLSM